MPESYVGLPNETWHAAGDKFRSKQRVVGANTVEEQDTAPAGDATSYLWAPSQACAQNKYFFAFLNGSISGKTRTLRKLFLTNAQMTAIISGTAPATVMQVEFQVIKATAIVGGTSITANPMDTTDPAWSNYTAAYSPTTVTEGAVMFSWYSLNDEAGLTGDFWMAMLEQTLSQCIEGSWGEMKEYAFAPGEGFCVKQISNTTLGAFAVLAVMSEDP